jgi:DGQHR domain-containing protein
MNIIDAEDQTFEVRCLKVKQPIGTFYIGVMNHDDLIKISYADIRRLETGSEMREVEIYTGIQRELSPNRVKEIGRYVNLIDATFPSSVILHIEEDVVNFDEKSSILTIPFRDNVAKVLDGQHRIDGLNHFEGGKEDFDVNVTIFVGMELEDQALVFATINQTQTKVNKSLVADLFAFATHRSPQKTCHNIVRALNQKEGSPFEDKIKILGTANDVEKETITQATFSKSLIQYISRDPMADRDEYKRGRTPAKYTDGDLERRPLRNLFIDEKDSVIAKILWEYFDAVRERWGSAWTDVTPELILNRSTGFIVLMRLFRPAYLEFGDIGEIAPKEFYLKIFCRSSLEANNFNKKDFLPGSTGQSQLYKIFSKEMGYGVSATLSDE